LFCFVTAHKLNAVACTANQIEVTMMKGLKNLHLTSASLHNRIKAKQT